MKDDYFTTKNLKERGWTKSKIELWLKEPDKLITNPFYKSAGKMKLYLKKRVKQQERNKRFKHWLEPSLATRRKISIKIKKSNDAKREELLNHINNLEIVIPTMDRKTLIDTSISHYNSMWESRGNYDKFARADDDVAFINRITVNYLRHTSEHYESELESIFGKIGKDEGYQLLKKRVNEAIYKTYPFLKEGTKNSTTH